MHLLLIKCPDKGLIIEDDKESSPDPEHAHDQVLVLGRSCLYTVISDKVNAWLNYDID